MAPLLGVMGIGSTELIIVCFIVLILFGHRLPTVMGSLGKGIRDFKRGINEPPEDDDVVGKDREKERINKGE